MKTDFNQPGKFTGYQRLLDATENKTGLMTVTLQHPTRRYFDEFLDLTCGSALLQTKVFPNAKELTEAFGIYKSSVKYIPFALNDPTVTVAVVGDGSTPRCAAVFAYRTKWTVLSIDPNFNLNKVVKKIKRLYCFADKIQNLKYLKHFKFKKLLVIMPHSHAPIDETLDILNGWERHLICAPCCKSLVPNKRPFPDISYDDWGIWSPERNIQIWLDV